MGDEKMQRIAAVKSIRTHTGAGLLEAKKAMDEIVANGYLADDTFAEQRVNAMQREHADALAKVRVEIDKLQRELGDARARATDAEVDRDRTRDAFRRYVEGGADGALRALLGCDPYAQRPYIPSYDGDEDRDTY